MTAFTQNPIAEIRTCDRSSSPNLLGSTTTSDLIGFSTPSNKKITKSQAIAARLKKNSTRSKHWEPKVDNVKNDLEITRKGVLRTDEEISAIKDVKNLSKKARKTVKKQMHKLSHMMNKMSIKDQRFLKYYDEEKGLYSNVTAECKDCDHGLVSYPIEPTGISYPRAWNFYTTDVGYIEHIKENIALTNIVGPISDPQIGIVDCSDEGIYYMRDSVKYVLIRNVVSDQLFLSPLPCPFCSTEGVYDDESDDDQKDINEEEMKHDILHAPAGELPFTGKTMQDALRKMEKKFKIEQKKKPTWDFSMETLLKFFEKLNVTLDFGNQNYYWLMVVEVLHDFLLTIHSLFFAHSTFDYYKAIYFLISKHTHATFESSLVSALCSTSIIAALKKMVSLFKSAEVSAEGFSDKLDSVRSVLHLIFDSGVAKAFKSIFLSILAFKVFPKNIAMSIFSVIGNPSKGSILEIFDNILAAFVKILKFSENLFSGMTIHDALMDDNPMNTHMDSSFKLLQYKNLLYSGMYVEGRMREGEFIVACKRELDFFEPIHKNINTASKEGKEIYLRYFALKAALDEVRMGSARLKRVAPIGVILVGQPGIGKSHILNLLMKIFSDVMKREYDESLLYTRIQGSDYWEGYDPASHPYIKYTEAGSVHRKIASHSGDPQLTEFVSLIDGQPYPVNMAFAEKGKVFAKPEFVIADTNVPDLNLPYIVNNPAAVRRRFIYIEPRVKEQYATDTGMIDKTKCNDGTYELDRWRFNIYEETAVDAVTSNRVTHSSDADVFFLQDWFSKRVEYHFRTESDILETMRNVLKSELPRSAEDFAERKRQEEIKVQNEAIEVLKNVPLPNPFDDDYIPQVAKHTPLEFVSQADEKFDIHLHSEVGDEKVEQIKRVPLIDVDQFAFAHWPKTEFVLGKIIRDPETAFWTLYNIQFTLWFLSPYLNQMYNVGGQLFQIFLQIIFMIFAFLVYIFGIDIYAWLVTYTNIVDMRNFMMYGETETAGYYGACRSVMFAKAYDTFQFRWNKMMYHLGLGRYNGALSPSVNNMIITFTKVIAALAVVKLASDFMKSKPKLQGGIVSKSTPSEVQEEIEKFVSRSTIEKPVEIADFESLCAVGTGFVRVPNKVATTWNTLTTSHSSKIKTETELKALKAMTTANTRYCTLTNGTDTWFTHILGLKGSIAIVPTHCLRDKYHGVRMCVSISGGLLPSGIDKYHVTILSQSNSIDLGADISMINLSSVRFQNLMPFIAEDKIYPSSIPCISHSGVESYGAFVPTQIANHKYTLLFYKDLISYNYPGHKGGDCGQPLIAKKDRGYCVAAMHVAGHDNLDLGYALCLEKKILVSAMEILLKNTSMLPISSESSDLKFDLGLPSSRSPFRYEDLSGVEFYGTLPGMTMINSKSKLVKTKIFDVIPQIFSSACGYEMDKVFCPPMMKPFVVDGKYFNPYNIALVNMAKQKKALDQELMNDIVVELTQHIVSELHSKGHKDWSPLSLHLAINGSADDKFLRRVTASTSAGYGFPGAKSKYLPMLPDSDDREANDLLRHRLAVMATRYMKDETNFCIYKAHLKDEPRDIEKVKQGKTRVFYASSIDNLILSRMFLAPYYTTMVEHSSVFSTCVGIDMHTQADELYDDLVKFSAFHMEGDYGKFDQSMPFDISRASCSVIYNVLEQMGYNPAALRVVRGIFSDSLFPIVDMNNDLLCNPGMQPSGKYATAEDNGMKGLLLLMYAWYKMVGRDAPFFENNRPKTYGDDVLNSVKPEYTHIFNNVTYAKFVVEHYGMEYTSAAKDGQLTEFVPANKMSFLKRKFVYSEEFGKIVAPLDMNSIMKAFMWTIPSDYVSEEEQIFSTATSMMRELVFCVDPTTHEKIRIAICDALITNFKLDSVRVMRDLKTFARIRDEILEKKPKTETYVDELLGNED